MTLSHKSKISYEKIRTGRRIKLPDSFRNVKYVIIKQTQRGLDVIPAEVKPLDT